MYDSCQRQDHLFSKPVEVDENEGEEEVEAGADPLPGSSRLINSGRGGSDVHHQHPLPTLDCATHHPTHHRSQATASNSRLKHYATDLCASPVASSISDESMNNHEDGDDITPPESLTKSANTGAAAEQIGRLSLDHGVVIATKASSPPCRGRHMLSTVTAVVSKRSASSELQRPGGHQVPRCCQTPRITKTVSRPRRRGPHEVESHARKESDEDSWKATSKHDKPRQPVRDDSGYASQHPLQCGNAPTRLVLESPTQQKPLFRLHAHSKYPGLMMQPHSSPISREQLAAEVKGIYAGLVMVEAKCTSIDIAQAKDTTSVLKPEQWQALIALHRTLLYEHHDFLMATQHPSATPALRCLPAKYNMPARMWKHGIHAFLEVLRHRRPLAQQYMLAFIYLAYQMMALLYETVPAFTDTWIECLGDLARYRMAIEEEKEAHALWGGVAARWYTMASDRHPAIGRLYHHLGILERPSLRKFCFYAKSLTCVIPFQNARDSLMTLCTPIIQDERTVQSSSQSAEARIVTYHALSYAKADQQTVDTVGEDALRLIEQQPSRLREFGAFLAVTNIAALFNYGDLLDRLWQLYMAGISLSVQGGRKDTPPQILASPAAASLGNRINFLASTFALIVRRPLVGKEDLCDCLPYLNVMLVWIHSLLALRDRLCSSSVSGYPSVFPVDLGELAWDGLACFLNALAGQGDIDEQVVEQARRGVFAPALPSHPIKAAPLAEDYLIRGTVWGQFYFCPGWFEGQGEDDGRCIENAEKLKARSDRVLLLGLYMAFHTSYLRFDESSKKFCAAVNGRMSDGVASEPTVVYAAADAVDSVLETSSSSNSEDGFTFVKGPRVEKGKSFVCAASQETRSARVR